METHATRSLESARRTRRSARARLLGAIVLVGCATNAPPKSADGNGYVPSHPDIEPAATLPLDGANAAQGDANPPSGLPETFGRVRVLEDRAPTGLLPPTAEAPSNVAVAGPVGRFRQQRNINVGVSHLFVGDIATDERTLLVFSIAERALRLYDFNTGRLMSKPPLSGFHAYGRGDVLLWPHSTQPPLVVFGGPHGLTLHDATSGLEVAVLSKRAAWDLRWAGHGGLLLATLPDIPEDGNGKQTSDVAFYRLSSTRELETELILHFEERVDAIAIDSKRERAVVTYYPSGDLELLDLARRRVLWKVPLGHASSVDISPDNRWIAVGGSRLTLLDMEDASRLFSYDKFDNNIHKVRFSPQGDVLAVSSYDGHVRIFKPTLEAPELTLHQTLRHAGTANVYALSFTRDGRKLVSTSGDHTVRIWTR